MRLEDEEVAEAADEPIEQNQVVDPEGKIKPKRKLLPDHLPRNELVLSVGDACIDCGGKLREVGRDITEELEYVPGRFVVNQIIRPRMACNCCETFIQAPLPSRPIDKGRPRAGLLAHVINNKYADHLPLYRQSQIFAREGVDLDRSKLAGWVGQATALLEPLADAIKRHVLEGKAIFADDTPVKLQAKGTTLRHINMPCRAKGKTKTARFWAYGRDERAHNSAAPPAVWYQFTPDRKGIHPSEHLMDHKGWMHADGYAGFEELYRSG